MIRFFKILRTVWTLKFTASTAQTIGRDMYISEIPCQISSEVRGYNKWSQDPDSNLELVQLQAHYNIEEI
jgi:hypothetical protein